MKNNDSDSLFRVVIIAYKVIISTGKRGGDVMTGIDGLCSK